MSEVVPIRPDAELRSDIDFVDYAISMLDGLRTMARGYNMELLSYLIGLAHLEAQQSAVARLKRAVSPPDENDVAGRPTPT